VRFTGGCADPDAVTIAFPAGHLYAVAQLRAALSRQPALGRDGQLRSDEAGARLVDADHVRGQPETGEAPGDIVRRQLLVRQTVQPGRGQRAVHDLAVRHTDEQTAGDRQDPGLPGVVLQLLPELVGAL